MGLGRCGRASELGSFGGGGRYAPPVTTLKEPDISIWTGLFGTLSHSPKVHRQLGLERLDDRVLPSVTSLSGVVGMPPQLPSEQLATPAEGLFVNPEAVINSSILADQTIDSPDAPKSITGTISLNAQATSSAEKGKFTPKGGRERESTDEELQSRIPYYMQYDGPTEFKAEYTIGLKNDGSFDPSLSSITLTTVYYTSRSYVTRRNTEISAEDEAELIKEGKGVFRSGDYAYIFSKPKLENDGWKTLPIQITEVSLKDAQLQSFKFKADAWYGNRPDSIIDKGIVGEIDLVTGKASFTAKYQSASTGVIATYVVEGTIKK